MAERKRNKEIHFYVTEEERKLIRRKMIESKTKNMGAYLRKMAIDGYIVNTDTTPLKKQYEEMHKIGVNINQIAKKDDVKRLVTRRTRDVLDRALNSIASIYRDVAVLQNNAEDSVGLINLENRSSITELSVRLNRAGAVTRLDEVAHARKRLAGNGNPLLVFESLFCALIP